MTDRGVGGSRPSLFGKFEAEAEGLPLAPTIKTRAPKKSRKSDLPPPAAPRAGFLFSVSTMREFGAYPEKPAFLDQFTGSFPSPAKVPFVCLDVETTARHKDEPGGVKKDTPIGGPWGETLGAYIGAGIGTVDTTPRMRIVTVSYWAPSQNAFGPPEKVSVAWDLDKMPPHQKKSLIEAILNDRVVLGHNITFDLMWMLRTYGECGGDFNDLVPREVVDTMLLMRMRPQLLTERLSKSQTPLEGLPLKKVFSKDTPRVSLDVIARAFNMGALDKSFQKPQNWMLSTLTPEHYDYCLGDVDVPVRLLLLIANSVSDNEFEPVGKGRHADPVRGATFSDPVKAIEFLKSRWNPFLGDYNAALWREVRMGIRGLPFDQPSAREKIEALTGEFNKAVATIVTMPEFASIAENLRDTSTGEDDATRTALSVYANRQGVTLGYTDKGKLATGDDALAFVGLAKDPVIKAYSTRRQIQRNLDSVNRWLNYAELGGGRLHTNMAHRAVTLRTSTESPNTQNFPAGDDYRALIHAEPGFLFWNEDYSAIELVIAAALGVQARNRLTAAIERGQPPAPTMKWIWREFMHHLQDPTGLRVPSPPDPNDRNLDFSAWRDYYAAALADLYIKSEAFPLREVFRREIDPHLTTALGFIEYDTKGMKPIDYLASLPKDEAEALKETLKGARKRAKANNFGLLYGAGDEGLHKYGIASYGLNWTIEEAAASRTAWLDMYPDIRLYQFLERLCPLEKNVGHMTANGWQDNGKLYRVQTLGGRTMETFMLTNALNWRDQGTGADIAARAIATLPADVERCLALFAHDELLLHAPERQILRVKEVVPGVMLDAANHYLAPYGVPVKTEGKISRTWGHSGADFDLTELPLAPELGGPPGEKTRVLDQVIEAENRRRPVVTAATPAPEPAPAGDSLWARARQRKPPGVSARTR